MKFLYLFFLLVIPAFLQAQLRLLPIATSHDASARTEKSNAAGDTLALPFWDDFSGSRNVPDSALWIAGTNVFVNNSLPTDPPTIFVATFDGVDKNGKAYDQNTTFSGLADVLESKPIDLTKVPQSRRNSVYLSFYWQLQGYGELPDEEDSLELQFMSADSAWISQNINNDKDHLALVGGVDNLVFGFDSLFTQVLVPISKDNYFHPGFKFRFRSFSNLSGIYDTWHIDYVYINEFRNANDRAVIDRALTGSPTLLFDPYYEMPLNQLLQDPGKYLSVQRMKVSNLGANLRPVDPFHHFVNLATGATTVLLDTLPQITIGGFENGKSFMGKDLGSLALGMDSVKIESIFSLFTGDTLLSNMAPDGSTLYYPVDLKVNDTLSTVYNLNNYYAYDDGSAEFAAGINLISGQLAVSFNLESPDFISHVQIQFPTVSPSSDGQTIDIQIWENLEEEFPIIAQPVVIKASSRNEFQTIRLNRLIQVSDTFFIGYKQFTNNYIGIGFDRNNTGGSDKIWTNVNRVWDQNMRLEGSMMIRPLFAATQEEKDAAISGIKESRFTVYPNPISSTLQISGRFDRMTILGLDGKQYFSAESAPAYDVGHLRDGIYIVRIYHNDLISIHKILVSR